MIRVQKGKADMASYDVKRLDVAIQYINRMTSGRNPVTNRVAPENEVLTNPNVNRCLQFISEILQDVRSQGGIVGKAPGRSQEPKVSIAQTFPYEVLKEFQYRQDQQISYFLKQISELSTDEVEVPNIAAVHINNWLREKGYLEKRMVAEIGKESSVPTEKGAGIGIYTERAGIGSNLYYRIWFNEQAQRFLIDHFREILTDTEEMRARKKQERKVHKEENKEKRKAERSQQEAGRTDRINQIDRTDSMNQMNRMNQIDRADPMNQIDQMNRIDRTDPAPGNELDDPALSSLLANLPDMDSYGREYNTADSFFGEGWETVDGGLPF